MAKQICKKDHSAIVSELYNLDESQAVIRGRHICAGCAYEQGFNAGQKAAQNQPPTKPKSDN
jgi:hypothetical protein